MVSRTTEEKGSILLEGTLGLALVLLPLFGFECEVIRASQYQALFHHWAFHYVRSRALGITERVAQHQIRVKAAAAFGPGEARRISRSFLSESWRASGGIRGRLKYRYPGFLPLLHSRFQVTKVCLFST
jgi:hypothetical protein